MSSRSKMYVFQYLIGLFVHVVYVAILLLVTPDNLQLPVGPYQENVWRGMDTMGYVQPAQCLLQSGQFRERGKAGFHRTIGYPLFLAGMMRLFGDQWVLWTHMVQAGLLALVYPALSAVAGLLFPARGLPLPWSVFVFSLVGTAYWSYAPQILTDGLFTFFLLAGLWCGLLSVVRRSWSLCFMGVLLIGFAAQIRPVLAIFPLANVLLLAVAGRRNSIVMDRGRRCIVLVSSAALLVACNGPSIRNYVNYGVFQPTDVFANNLAQYLGRQVTRINHEQDAYDAVKQEVKRLKADGNFGEVIAVQNRFAMQTFRSHPGTTLLILSYNTFWNMFECQWQNTFFLWRMNGLRSDTGSPSSVVVLAWLWVGLYAVVYYFFFRCLVEWVKDGEWLFVAGLLLFLLPLAATFVAGQGARMRIWCEGIIVICAFSQMLAMIERRR